MPGGFFDAPQVGRLPAMIQIRKKSWLALLSVTTAAHLCFAMMVLNVSDAMCQKPDIRIALDRTEEAIVRPPASVSGSIRAPFPAAERAMRPSVRHP